MRSKLIAILCLTIFLCALVTGCNSGEDGTIDVPIKILTDKKVVAVAFELLYDPLVLEAVSVDKSTLATGADAAYDKSTPGVLLIVVTNAEKLDRDGTLVVARFNIVDETGSSDLTIDFKAAEDADTREALPFEVSGGRFDATDMSVEPPVITLG
ncbi:MAG: hypothetical protein A2Y72_06930 [Chloroflexi bacterium RBG_13_53_26]|jgi:hypothetical protein|nr:MAG: hypothetical protein A2Y72_06930 [Chloroflexi bacterium RBG_13_53_26]